MLPLLARLAVVVLLVAFASGVPAVHADVTDTARAAGPRLTEPAVHQSACPTPRPPVRLQTQGLGDGKIQVTVTAGSGTLALLRFGVMQNAHVEFPGSSQTYGSNAEIKVPSGLTSLTFLVIGSSAAQSGQTPPTATVPLVVVDGCGPSQPWSTFVGGGASSLTSVASVADTQVTEGNAGNTVLTFTVSLSVPSSKAISVSYATNDGTAKAGLDYVAASGTVTFNPGETSKTVTIQVRGNLTRAPDKTFSVTLSNPVNAQIGRAHATARIVDDDVGPSASGDSYIMAAGQTLTVGAGAGPPPGLLVNDDVPTQDAQIVSFGGLSAGGDVTSNPAGSTANLGNGGSLRVNADGGFTFTPPTGFGGSFSFRYRASTASGPTEATVIVDVGTAPNAVDDPAYGVTGSTVLQVPAARGLLANDTLGTPPGTIVSFGGGNAGVTTVAGQGRELGGGGSLFVNADGSFTLIAPTTFSGPFTFQYRLQNAVGSDDASVTIEVRRGATVTTTGSVTAFLEGSLPVPIDSGATVSTPGGANLSQLTATISGLSDVGHETLAATTAGTSITASYTAPTLTLTGDDTVANYQQVLRSITYQNTAASPAIATRTIQLQATSAGQASAIATKQVAVVRVNDAPVGASATVTIDEDTAYPFTVADFGFDDPNDNPKNLFAAVKIASLPAKGTLLLGKTPVTLGQVIDVGDLTAGPLTFRPDADANGSSYASFQFQVQDDGGTANNGLDLDQTPRTLTIDVTAVNDAPVNTLPPAQTMAQDAVLTLSTANGNAMRVSDVDATSLVVSLESINGTMQIKGASGPVIGTAGPLSGPTTINDLLNGLTFTPTKGYAGLASITITTRDAGQTGSGGERIQIDTLPIIVNGAPVLGGVDGSFTYTENDPATAIATALKIDDANSATFARATATVSPYQKSGEDVLAFVNAGPVVMGNIAVESNVGGVLTLKSDGATATREQWENALRAVTYENTSEAPSTLARTVSYQIDDGEAANSQSNVVKREITVKDVNDEPKHTAPIKQTFAGDTTLTFSAKNGNAISIGDPDAGSGNLTVTIATTAPEAKLTFATTKGLSKVTDNAGTISAIGTLADLKAALDGLVLTPKPGWFGSATITLNTNDNGNTGGGAKTATSVISLEVTPPKP